MCSGQSGSKQSSQSIYSLIMRAIKADSETVFAHTTCGRLNRKPQLGNEDCKNRVVHHTNVTQLPFPNIATADQPHA